jgi:hypothetical protein
MSGQAPSAEPQMPHTALQQIELAGQNVLPHCTAIVGLPAVPVLPAVDVEPPLELRPPLVARPPVDELEPPSLPLGDERTTPPHASAKTAQPVSQRWGTPTA